MGTLDAQDSHGNLLGAIQEFRFVEREVDWRILKLVGIRLTIFRLIDRMISLG